MSILKTWDKEYFKRAEKAKRKATKPEVGDYILLNPTETPERISKVYEDGDVQVEKEGAYYIYENGEGEFSGTHSTKEFINRDLLVKVGTRLGSCWTFSEGEIGKDRGVDSEILFNLFKIDTNKK